MSEELYIFIKEIFKCGFDAGRLYTFENKVVTMEKLDFDIETSWDSYLNMKMEGYEDGKSWYDKIKEFNTIIEKAEGEK